MKMGYCQSIAKRLAAAAAILVCLPAAAPLVVHSAPLSQALSAEQVSEEVALVQQLVEAQFPNLGLFTTAAEFSAHLTTAARRPHTVRSFAVDLRTAVSTLGDGHACVDLPQRSLARLPATATLPFDLSIQDTRLVIDAVTPGLPFDSELLRLNGQPARELMSDLSAITCADGGTPAARLEGAANQFSYLHLLHADLPDKNNLTVRTAAGENLQLTLERLDSAHWRLYNQADGSGPRRAFFISTSRSKRPAVKLTIQPNGDVAVLTLGSFLSAPPLFRSKLEIAMAELASSEVRNVVLDLRGNRGGQTENSGLLLSLFASKPLAMPARYHLTRTGFNKRNEITHPTGGDLSIREAEALRTQASARKRRILAVTSREPIQPRGVGVSVSPTAPLPNAFTGQVHLLVDPLTSSAATLFAATLAAGEPERVTVHGQWANDTPHRGCAHPAFSQRLPHSGLSLTIPWLCFDGRALNSETTTSDSAISEIIRRLQSQ